MTVWYGNSNDTSSKKNVLITSKPDVEESNEVSRMESQEERLLPRVSLRGHLDG